MAGLAHLPGHLLLSEAVFLHQSAVAPGLLGGIQVLPLEILDESQLHHLAVVRLDDDGGHLPEPGGLGRPPPPLPGDNLVVAGGQPAHRQGLNDSVDPDGLGQVGQSLLVKALPGLVQSGLHLGNGQRDGTLVLLRQVWVAQQGVQPPAQTQFCLSFCHIVTSQSFPRPAACRPPRPGNRDRKPRWACRGWGPRTDGRSGE